MLKNSVYQLNGNTPDWPRPLTEIELETVLLSSFCGEQTSQAGLCWGQLAGVIVGEVCPEVLHRQCLWVNCAGQCAWNSLSPRAGMEHNACSARCHSIQSVILSNIEISVMGQNRVQRLLGRGLPLLRTVSVVSELWALG